MRRRRLLAALEGIAAVALLAVGVIGWLQVESKSMSLMTGGAALFGGLWVIECFMRLLYSDVVLDPTIIDRAGRWPSEHSSRYPDQ